MSQHEAQPVAILPNTYSIPVAALFIISSFGVFNIPLTKSQYYHNVYNG